MNIDVNHSALQGIAAAQHKVASAAETIASFPLKENEVGSPNYKSTDLIKPILSLSEAELQNSASVKVLKANNEMLGSFLDVHA